MKLTNVVMSHILPQMKNGSSLLGQTLGRKANSRSLPLGQHERNEKPSKGKDFRLREMPCL